MLIFNTTYKISNSIYDKWLSWTFEKHIPFMIKSGKFESPQVAKVIGSEDDNGLSYSVQFKISDMDSLLGWHKKNATVFQQNCAETFGTEVVFFSTVLEIIE